MRLIIPEASSLVLPSLHPWPPLLQCHNVTCHVKDFAWRIPASRRRGGRGRQGGLDRIVQKHPDKKMIAVTAMERRLLLLIYALWKSDKPYDKDYNKKK